MMEKLDADLHALGFSLRTAYYLAHASIAAYDTTLGDWPECLGLGAGVQCLDHGKFRGLVGSLGKVVLVAFRGTCNTGNFLTDADTALVARTPTRAMSIAGSTTPSRPCGRKSAMHWAIRWPARPSSSRATVWGGRWQPWPGPAGTRRI